MEFSGNITKVRIYFDDTSTKSNYPRNDWKIIINDSASNGGTYNNSTGEWVNGRQPLPSNLHHPSPLSTKKSFFFREISGRDPLYSKYIIWFSADPGD